MRPEVHIPIDYRDVLEVCKRLMVDDQEHAELFERELANYVGVPYAKCTPSGRSALYLILRVLGMAPGDEVIIPAYASPIIPEVLVRCKVRPIFAGVDTRSLNVNPQSIRRAISSRTKGILVVHTFGNPCRCDEMSEIALDNGIIHIEDAAQALGAEYSGKRVGSFGEIGLFSFGLGKNITTIEGGMIVTRRSDLAEKIEEATRVARKSFLHTTRILAKLYSYPALTSPGVYTFTCRGWSLVRGEHRFDEDEALLEYSKLQAILGRLQLRRIEAYNQTRILNAKRIIDAVRDLDWLSVQEGERGARPVFLRLILRHSGGIHGRDRLKQRLFEWGFDIPTLEDYCLIRYMNSGTCAENTRQMFGQIQRELVDKVLALPTSPSLSSGDLDILIKVLRLSR